MEDMLHASPNQSTTDVICLSHLRWNFVFQRPQHLMTRCARERRVFFVEEPEFRPGIAAHLQIDASGPVTVVVPQLDEGLSPDARSSALRRLLTQIVRSQRISDYVLWYYTPMALAFTDHLQPRSVVYDCMDELSAFKGAPTVLTERE